MRWAHSWPDAGGPFAPPMNEISKVVFSNSLASADWGPATIVSGDLAAAVTRLKQEQPDGYLLAQGGVRFARSLVQTGLIDEYRLAVQPVILGAGERLFTDAADHPHHEHYRVQSRSRGPRLHCAPLIKPVRLPRAFAAAQTLHVRAEMHVVARQQVRVVPTQLVP